MRPRSGDRLHCSSAGVEERQTRWSQTPLRVSACGFESRPRHSDHVTFADQLVAAEAVQTEARDAPRGRLPLRDHLGEELAHDRRVLEAVAAEPVREVEALYPR